MMKIFHSGIYDSRLFLFLLFNISVCLQKFPGMDSLDHDGSRGWDEKLGIGVNLERNKEYNGRLMVRFFFCRGHGVSDLIRQGCVGR